MEAGTATRRIATRARVRAIAADYFDMMKPRVQTLLLFTTITTMYVAGSPSIGLVALTCLGGALSAGGAGAINHWFDRDLDAVMVRTSNRPVPSGRVAPANALIFGILLGTSAFVLLAGTVNVLAAVLSLCGLLGYVFVYTIWLKRRTPQNIVIGGAAGAFPPLIGWAAATGRIELLPVLLFTLVFLWTPPHFWALSLFINSDYAKAGVPMMSVVAGTKSTRLQIFLYSLPMAAAAVLPWPLGLTRGFYGVTAAFLSFWFLALAGRVGFSDEADPALMKHERRLFAFSILYLFVLFGALVIDRMMP